MKILKKRWFLQYFLKITLLPTNYIFASRLAPQTLPFGTPKTAKNHSKSVPKGFPKLARFLIGFYVDFNWFLAPKMATEINLK